MTWSWGGRRVLPRVFLSYAQGSPEHIDAVRQLFNLLQAAGVQPEWDMAHGQQGEEHDWVHWCQQQVEECDWVLVIASAAYKRRADSPHQLPEDEGRGVWWEASKIRRRVYDARNRFAQVLPVILPGESVVHLPGFLDLDDDAVITVPSLDSGGVAELATILRREILAPAALGEAIPAGWVYAGAGAGRVAAEVVREHIELRGRGHRSTARGENLFHGRAEARAAIAGWLAAPQPPGRVLVVTGRPGAGKSAVVARVALDLEPDAIGENRRLGLVFHARSATFLDLLHAVAVTTRTSTAKTVSELLSQVEGVTPPPGGAWRVVVDALDEAAPTDIGQLVQTLTELAALPQFRVVVATRAQSAHDPGRFAPGSLLTRLGVRGSGDDSLVDLDTDRFFDESGLVDFAAALLAQRGTDHPTPPDGAWRTYRGDEALCLRLAAAVARRADRNHLVAALTADQLSRQSAVVNPTAAGFDANSLPATVGEALAKYLDQQPPTDRERVRGLLTALAYARGSGVTDRLWLDFAWALEFRPTKEDLQAVRHSPAADYLLESTTAEGEIVTRLFHQALIDELLVRPGYQADERAILRRLVPTAAETWADASTYAKAYASEHAHAAGRLGELLADPIYPTVADLVRLLPHLPGDPSDPSAEVAAVLRTASARGRDLESSQQRASLLALTAAHLGLPELAYRYRQAGNPLVSWAHSPGSIHQTLSGHTMRVEAVAVGRVDNRDVIVSGGRDGTVRVWDAITGIGNRLPGHIGAVHAVAVGRAGGRDLVVSGGHDRTVRIWDVATGTLTALLNGHLDAVRSVAVGRVGDRPVVVSGGRDRVIRVWDATSGELIRTLAGHHDVVRSVVIGRVNDRDMIVSGGDDNAVRRWDAATGDAIGDSRGSALSGHESWVRSVALGRAGDRAIIVSGSDDKHVRVWDASTGELLHHLAGHLRSVRSVTAGRAGDRDVVVSGSEDNTVRVWDASTGAAVRVALSGHIDLVRSVALGQAGDRTIIVSGSDDKTVRVWDTAAGATIGHPLTGHPSSVRSVALGRVGEQEVVVSGSDDNTVRRWETTTGLQIGDPLTGRTKVTSVAIGSVTGRPVIAASEADYTVRVWDAIAGSELRARVVGQAGHSPTLAMGQISDQDAVVVGSRGVRIWATSTDAVTNLVGRTVPVAALAIGPCGDGAIIVSADADAKTLQRWDATTRRPTGAALVGHSDPVTCVAIGRAGTRDIIVSGSADTTVRRWDAITGAPIDIPLVGHDGPVTCVAIGRAGTRDIIVSGSDDETVRLWDAATGLPLATQATLSPVESVAISGDRVAFAAGITVGILMTSDLV